MAKQLNVNLAFKAETGQAKQAIMDLQSALSKVASMNINTPGLDANKLKAASSAAKELSIHLNNAFNAETGNFDLSKLDRSLKTSSTNVTELSSKLLGAGASGEQAFVKLAQSIAAADRPVVTLNSKLNGMLTTLKNTARWQISSSILHGFIGAVQQAYGYAQDLNESLTNIRIVTGQNMEQMSKFATEANKAAKALSTTTTEYTNASLIYYQQGLSDAEVAKRTEVTIKMANAAGQSAQIVSDQLTAVWNNFYDGSKSLEYYADVMTALGAATASSTDEIAGGLEKFAAIADTIGLSYEYAASALATITANTRQSEEVVGTALKTIFARIQGLNLGETLDDGTTLNKYSEALQKVGISIFDQAGELKDMDNILDEMGEKWQTLNKAQQTALAQTVAGTRQYTQLVALMDNWDSGDSDSMQANLTTSYNAEGTLQDQADIYAESWEAARDRVRASLETIYNQLLDDDFFIDISNGFAGLLDSVSAFIDGIGGIKTILIAIGSIFLSSVANKIQPALMNLKHTFSVVFQSAEKQAQSLAGEMNKGIQNTLDSSVGKNFSDASKIALQNAMTMNSAKAKLQGVESNLNDLEKQRFNLELQMLQADQDAAQAVADKITKRKEEIALLKEAFDYESSTKTLENSRGKEEEDLIDSKRAAEQAYLADPTNANKTALTEATNQLNEHRAATERLVNAREQYAKSLYDAYNTEMQTTQGAIDSSTKLYSVQQMMPDVVEHYTKALSGMQAQSLEKQRETFARLKGEIEQIVGDSCPDLQKAMDAAFKSRSPEAFKKNISGVMQALKDAKIPAKDLEKILSSMGQGKNVKQIKDQYKALGKETSDLAERQRKLNAALEEFNPKHTVTGIERVTQAAAGLGQVAMLAQSVRSIFQAWGNDDLSFGEKLMTTFTGLSMIIPSAIGAFKSLNVAMNGSLTTAIAAAMANKVYNATIDQQVSKESQVAIMKRLANGASLDAITAGIAESAVKKGLIKEEEKENYILALKAKFKSADMLGSLKNAAAKLLEAIGIKTKSAADKTETAGIWAKVAAKIAELAASWPLLAVTLLIVAAIAALAAIVAIVVTAIQAMVQAYNADAIAAEKAEASARALAEAYNEAKQSYEDMIAAMDEYKSAREALDSLTEGTQEYQDALEKANRAALELINNNPELFDSSDYKWENGQLIIDDKAMQDAQIAAKAKESSAYAAMQMGQAEAKEARNVADETALRRELVKDSTTGSDYLAGALTGAFSTAAFGTVLATAIGGPLGLAIGGALMGTGALTKGALGGAAMTGTLEAKKLEESDAINKAIAAYQKDSSLFEQNDEQLKATLQIEDDDIIKALRENKEAVMKLSDAQEAQARQEQLAAQQSAQEILKNSKYSDQADEMTYAAGAAFQKANDAAYDAILKNMDSKGGLKAGANAYFESQGISSKQGFKVDKYDAKNGTVSYSYLDESGQRQEMEITAEQIAMTQAVIQAQNELLDSCGSIATAFDNLDKDIQNVSSSTATLSEGMKAFLSSGDTGQLTKEQYDAMAGMSDSQMKDYLASMGVTDANIQDFGYNDVAAMIADMDLANTGDQWAKYQNITAHQGTEDLTLNQAENINNALKDIADFFGEEVGHEMLDLSAAMADSLDEAAQDDFWEQLGNISDYADADQWDAFLEAMKDSEDMTDEQIQALENYVDTAKLAARATKDLNFDEMAESVRSLRDIMKNISEGEREISDEEFAALEAQGIDTSKFAKTIDGYRYLGESGDLVADISEGITKKFKDAEQNFANIAATAAQASQNLIDAEAELAEAKAAGDRARAAAEAGATNQLTNTEKLSVIMSNIVNNVVSKIKSAWDWICGVMMDIYDFFATTFNAIGQGITDIWNGFLQIIEDIINGVVGGVVDLLEEIPGVDIDWEDIGFEKADFEGIKTTEEIEAEENAKKAEEDLIAATQELADAIPDMVNSIESSADYLSEAELEAGRVEAEQNYNTAQSQYDAAVSTYGKDSTQAKYYEQLVAYYEAQMEAYANALDSKAWGEVIAEGIDTKEMESYIDLLEQAHPEMRKLYKTTEDYENALLQVATANKKMEKGVKSLSSNWDKWNGIMSDSEASASDIATILPDVNDALQDVLNLDTSEFAMLPPDFAKKHWNLIQDVVNGVEGSVDTLRNMAGQEILMTIDGVVDPDGNIDAQFLALHEKIASFDQSQFTVGVAIDPQSNADFIAACNDIIQKAGMTAEQAQAYFASMGYDIKLKPVKQKVTETQWNHIYRNIYDAKGNPAGRVIQKAWPSTFTGEVDALAIETITPNGSYGGGIGVETTPPKTSRSDANGDTGGGGAPDAPDTEEKRDTTNKSDVVERYREVEDAIDNVTDALTRAERATDRLWGKDKLAAMRKENDILKEQRKLLLDKAAEAEEYAKQDAANLRKVAQDMGVSVVIDQETGDITNAEDVEEELYRRLSAAEAEYNAKVEAYNAAVKAATKADGTVSEADADKLEKMKDDLEAYEETIIGDIEDDISAWEDAEQQFKDSVETWEESGLEAEAILDEIMQNNYDIIMEGLEIPLSLNEEDLRLVELKLAQIEDDMYSMSEAVALTASQLTEYQDNLRLADDALTELNRAHEAGEITDAAYQEGLAEIRDKYYDNVEALMELDKVMKEYYSNTVDMANEELSKYTDQMEHQTSVLEHYNSLIELMGKSNDYKMIGKVLEGQVETTRNSMEVSKQWYKTQRDNADALAAEYAAAQASGASEAELEIIKKNWEAAEASANEAQEQMLSDAEAWAEALKAVLENELADLGQSLENALTGGTSFDALTTSMERAASLQEDYLTTTNQIYETNKLMRTAQQEIDKTTNSVAKQKLKAYINETEQLQNQSKLSKYELEIQQAKYDLLLAEIALQEAQDAKSSVRLQRDSEGNFGYVYTADKDKVADAQQKLADAQNALYNKGLEGANEYTEKYQQTMQEMYDTLADIQQKHLNKEYETEEEYHQAMAAAKEYYYQKLQDYSSLYSVAVSTDSRVVADAWSTDFSSMIYDTDTWMQAVDDYTDGAVAAFKKWSDAVHNSETGIAAIVGGDVAKVGENVKEVTDKSKALAETTTKEVIPALDKELDSVNNLTGAYGKMRDTIKDTIAYYTDMINRINNSQTHEWNKTETTSNTSSGDTDTDTGDTDTGNTNTGDQTGGDEENPAGNDDGQGSGSGNDGPTYQTGTLKFTGNGAGRIWTDATGKSYAYGSPEQIAMQKAFDKAYGRNGGYKGDYWIGWTDDGGKLNADVLHEKYGLATGGYTGDWAGSYGKLAFLHQKELVLNAGDTENFLASMDVMERILQMIDLQAASAQLGGLLTSPGYSGFDGQTIEQNVHIEASFPSVQDRNEIEEAFNTLINRASQYANRK